MIATLTILDQIAAGFEHDAHLQIDEALRREALATDAERGADAWPELRVAITFRRREAQRLMASAATNAARAEAIRDARIALAERGRR